MDHIRKELDQLMGKDRNLPLAQRLKKKEHFNDTDVRLGQAMVGLGVQAFPRCVLPTRSLSKHQGGLGEVSEEPRRVLQEAVREGPEQRHVPTAL